MKILNCKEYFEKLKINPMTLSELDKIPKDKKEKYQNVYFLRADYTRDRTTGECYDFEYGISKLELVSIDVWENNSMEPFQICFVTEEEMRKTIYTKYQVLGKIYGDNWYVSYRTPYATSTFIQKIDFDSGDPIYKDFQDKIIRIVGTKDQLDNCIQKLSFDEDDTTTEENHKFNEWLKNIAKTIE